MSDFLDDHFLIIPVTMPKEATVTMTETKPVELSSSELEELGIEQTPEELHTAYRLDDDNIILVVQDLDGGSSLDPPNEDHSGENAWQWIAFDNGRQRDEYIERMCDPDDSTEAFDPARDFWIERYEHGMVRYALIGEASQVDRQWDVAGGVAIVRFKPDHGCGADGDVAGFVRGICEEYTDWCNGSVYGLIRYKRRPPIDAPTCPIEIPDEYQADAWEEHDSVWGYIGYDNAVQAAKAGDC